MKTLEFPWMTGLAHTQKKSSWTRIFNFSIALLSIALFSYAYQTMPNMPSFGHDEVHYYKSFYFKLSEDGRWLNYILHNFLRLIPVNIWAIAFLAASWTLFFRLAVSIGLDTSHAILAASTMATALPFVEQSLWPATTIPAIAILLISSLFIERQASYKKIYIFSGAFIFGSLQSFYFLLPLFFLKTFNQPWVTEKNRWKLFFSHMAWWIAGAVAGVLLMSILLWLKTGSFGVRPAEWRITQPIHDWHGLVRNTSYATNAFFTHIVQIARNSGTDNLFFVSLFAICGILRFNSWIRNTQTVLLIVAVGAAFFAFSIPLAPVIQSRSLIALSTAFIVAIAVLPGRTAFGRIASVLMLLIIIYNNSINANAYLHTHKSTSQHFHESFKNLLSSPIDSYSAISLHGTIDTENPLASTFNSPPLMHAIIYSLGAKDYWDCRQEIDKRCTTLTEDRIIAEQPFADGKLQLFVTEKNIAMIKYQPSTIQNSNKP